MIFTLTQFSREVIFHYNLVQYLNLISRPQNYQRCPVSLRANHVKGPYLLQTFESFLLFICFDYSLYIYIMMGRVKLMPVLLLILCHFWHEVSAAGCSGLRRVILDSLEGTVTDGEGFYEENAHCEWLIRGEESVVEIIKSSLILPMVCWPQGYEPVFAIRWKIQAYFTG